MSKKTRHADNSKRQQPTQKAQAHQPTANGPSKARREGKKEAGKDTAGQDMPKE